MAPVAYVRAPIAGTHTVVYASGRRGYRTTEWLQTHFQADGVLCLVQVGAGLVWLGELRTDKV